MAIPSYGQEKHTLGFFRSFPIGAYKSTKLDNGSFAMPGWGVSYENNSRFEAWPVGLTVGLHISYQSNQLNKAALADAYSQVLRYDTQIGDAHYRPVVVTIGPHYDLAVAKTVSVIFKTGLGVMFTNIDSFVINVQDSQNNLLFSEVIDFEGFPTITFSLGTGITFKPADNFSIGLFADYSRAKEQVKASLGNINSIQSDLTLSFINTGISMSIGF